MPDSEKSSAFAARKIYPFVFWGIAALVFVAGTWLRFKLDALPAATADTWGYLKPAIAALAGGEFETAWGRPYLYPSFLYLAIGVLGDFRTISVIQHLAGLAAGGLLLAALLSFRKTQSDFIPSALADAAFLCAITVFLTSNWQADFEHSLMTEALQPALYALILLCFAHVAAAFAEDKKQALFNWGTGLASAGIFSVLYQPRFALGAVLCAACGGAAVFKSGALRKNIARVIIPVLIALVFVWGIGGYLSRNDLIAKTMTADVLFSAHLPPIKRALDTEADKSPGAESGFYRQLSARITRDMEKIPASSTIGYYPFYAQWHGSCRLIAEHFNRDAAKVNAFELRWLARAIAREPGWYLSKVKNQLYHLYGWNREMLLPRTRIRRLAALPITFVMRLGVNERRSLQSSWFYGYRELVKPGWRDAQDDWWRGEWAQFEKSALSPGPLNRYLSGIEASLIKNPHAGDRIIGGLWGGIFDKAPLFSSVWYVPALLATLLMAGIVTWRKKWSRELAALAALSAFAHLCMLAIALFCATIFVLEDLRYFLDAGVFLYTAHYAGLAFCACAALRFFRKFDGQAQSV
ncbi:MAG: hypothetical protein PHP45_09505 [Elusimicrobiales bacterium]|nr:hypothetical protein [Elusimicrobiales bacterium]